MRWASFFTPAVVVLVNSEKCGRKLFFCCESEKCYVRVYVSDDWMDGHIHRFFCRAFFVQDFREGSIWAKWQKLPAQTPKKIKQPPNRAKFYHQTKLSLILSLGGEQKWNYTQRFGLNFWSFGTYLPLGFRSVKMIEADSLFIATHTHTHTHIRTHPNQKTEMRHSKKCSKINSDSPVLPSAK